MLSKIISRSTQKRLVKASDLLRVQARSFGHGPYNPMAYKTVIVPEEFPS